MPQGIQVGSLTWPYLLIVLKHWEIPAGL